MEPPTPAPLRLPTTIMTTTKLSTSSPNSRPRAFYKYLTLDLILHILSRSIFHPFIVLTFYLSLAAIHKHTTPLAAYTLYYAAFLFGIDVLIYLNRRITDGPSRRVEWGSEVLVITGGATGLGRCLVEMFAMRGVSVAVLDVRGPPEEVRDGELLVENGGCVGWWVCDVSDERAVREVAQKIRAELGRPTILINNAATSINGSPLFPSLGSKRGKESLPLRPERIKQTIDVNVLGNFNTLTAVLEDVSDAPNGGTIVTVSSILGHLGPANLTDYAASKAAVSSLHHTLTNEIRKNGRSHKVKTILAEVGQVATDLFRDVQTPWYAQFVGPTLEVKDVAKEIVRLLDKGQGGVIRMPMYAKIMVWYGVMPGSLQRFVRWFSGIDEALGGSCREAKQSHMPHIGTKDK